MGISLNQVMVNYYNRKSLCGTVVDDTPIAIRIHYKGTGTITSVTTTAATSIVMITSDGGTETFAFATYTTVGALADAINASAYWECKVLDGLRADATANKFIDGAITAGVVGSYTYYDVLSDTDALDSYSFRMTTSRDVGVSTAGGHKIKFIEAEYNVNISAATANGIRIYEWDPVAKSETQIFRKASVDATKTTVNIASGNSTLDASKPGNDLIFRVTDSAITDAGANYLDVSYIVE